MAGLRLLVKPSGARSWVLRTMVGSRRAEIGLGGYPTVTLAQAFDYAREALQAIRAGVDPAAERRAKRTTIEWTFQRTAEAYIAAHRAGWKNAKHAEQWGEHAHGIRLSALRQQTRPGREQGRRARCHRADLGDEKRDRHARAQPHRAGAGLRRAA